MMAGLGTWLDERLGTRALGRALFGRKIPAGTGWLYTLGSVSAFVFGVQAVTGMFLAMSYAPAPDHAFDSVRFVSDGIPFGSIVRGLHVWGATAMVVAVALHMLRTFVTGAYKYPREATWMTGVGLLLLVLGFGFTGYLLPWNQKAYWATQVGTTIAEQAPVVGPAIARVLRGGDELGAQTLTRFYALHVLVLPSLVLALIAIHLFMVVRQGVSAPPVRAGERGNDIEAERARAAARYADEKEAGKPFYPYTLAKDAAAILVVVLVLLGLAVVFPPELGEIADPTDATYNPRPEWYFLFLFQLLKYFPGRLESVAAVVLPSVAIIALVVLPLVDRRMRRHPRDRPLAMAAAAVAVVTFGVLTVLGARSPFLSAYVPVPPAVADGQRVSRELHCEHCHSVRGRGGIIGPDLALAAPEHDAAWMMAHLRDPQAIVPGSAMPAMGLLDDEITALVAYVEELRGGGPYSEAAPKLFRRYCTECHRLAGRGGDKGPDLTGIGAARGRAFLHRYIEDPKSLAAKSKMPAFLAPEGPLTHAQVEDVARYLAVQRESASAPSPAPTAGAAAVRDEEERRG